MVVFDKMIFFISLWLIATCVGVYDYIYVIIRAIRTGDIGDIIAIITVIVISLMISLEIKEC